MRTPLRILAAAATLAVLLTGCSKDAETPPTGTPGETPSATASATPEETPTVTPTPDRDPTDPPSGDDSVVCADKSKMKPFTGPAAVEFGAKNVMDAYCETADFFFVNSITNVTPPGQYSAQELSFVNKYLTSGAVDFWNKEVEKAQRTGDWSLPQTLIYVNQENIADLGLTFPDADDPVKQVGGQVSEATTRVLDNSGDLGGGLGMSFSVTTNVVLVDKKGDKVVMPVTRNVAVNLVATNDKNPDGKDWLIGRWETNYASEKVIPFDEFTNSDD